MRFVFPTVAFRNQHCSLSCYKLCCNLNRFIIQLFFHIAYFSTYTLLPCCFLYAPVGTSHLLWWHSHQFVEAWGHLWTGLCPLTFIRVKYVTSTKSAGTAGRRKHGETLQHMHSWLPVIEHRAPPNPTVQHSKLDQ